jgi:hypothetical protein
VVRPATAKVRHYVAVPSPFGGRSRVVQAPRRIAMRKTAPLLVLASVLVSLAAVADMAQSELDQSQTAVDMTGGWQMAETEGDPT